MSAATVVHNHIVSILPCRHLATNSKLESTKLCTQNVTNTLCLYTTPGYLTDRNSSVATLCYYTHTYPFNGPFSGTTRVSRYQKVKTNLDFTGAKDSEWQWHQLGHMQVCTSLQTDNHASTPPLSFYRPDALPAAQPTASKHWRHNTRKPNPLTLLPLTCFSHTFYAVIPRKLGLKRDF